jgi:hypothetical protein
LQLLRQREKTGDNVVGVGGRGWGQGAIGLGLEEGGEAVTITGEFVVPRSLIVSLFVALELSVTESVLAPAILDHRVLTEQGRSGAPLPCGLAPVLCRKR